MSDNYYKKKYLKYKKKCNALIDELYVKPMQEMVIYSPENKISETEESSVFSYDPTKKSLDCYLGDPIPLDFFNDNDLKNCDLPAKFKLVTWNIWGIDNVSYPMLNIRLPYIVDEMKKTDANIICLQEVSDTVYQYLLKDQWILDNYFISQHYLGEGYQISCLILSKHLPKRGYFRLLHGEHIFSAIVIDMGNFLILNHHAQAGSKYSGDISHPEKYTTCRKDHLKMLIDDLDHFKKPEQDLIIVGDFNFDIGNPEWEENDLLTGWKDVWNMLHPEEKGYTEDTNINLMRWNIKQNQKLYRYDGILYQGNKINPQQCELIGTESIAMIDIDDLQDEYKKTFKKVLDTTQMKGVDNGMIPWWSSDHFGLVATLKIY